MPEEALTSFIVSDAYYF